ncbi:squamosa promoter-binding-like protein 1 isoform X2 [Cornus florida]|uniref:squamosa promoter-binding-like protein 1 isoform X2 n=1 Tax=Cornus florida TaxID=4283 RepID=UPI0028A1C2A9|nr:squamosa promoter-binding-like protein 1 isoform X2 [Cornus florida]
MEAKFGGKAHHFYGPVVSDLKAVGKRTMEWDLNDWKWDGDLFTATPLNSVPSDCRNRQLFPVGSEIPAITGLSNSSSSCSDEINLGNEKGKRELEKRRRVVIIDDEELNDGAGSLNLKLGGQAYPIMESEGKSGKKTKVGGATSNRAVCQVEDCRADLSSAKDYHRRHKVCDIHSKASRALVGNVLQRFCQQCSRFHVLQEFDEGKRSCRRRLAGHNRRRRKTHPENVLNGGSLNDEQSSSYLLISLLRILSNMHSNSLDQAKDQDLLSHLLRNLASLAGTINGRNIPGLLPSSQDLQNAGTSVVIPEKDPPRSIGQCVTASASEMTQKRIFTDDAQGGTLKTPSASKSSLPFPTKDCIPPKTNVPEITEGRIKLTNIDLNNVYDDSQDCTENLERSCDPGNLGTGSLDCPIWVHQDSHKSSPPQTSANSGSTSTQSPSSSSGEAQGRTDRIVFKLFGKNPSDFPLLLRKQILDWLSHSPTEIESYIRPGCIILTIYLHLKKSAWEQLCCDLSSSLSRLLDESKDSFWRTGWVYTRVQHRVAFIYNGQVVLDTSLPLKSRKNCRISSIKPIAVSVTEKSQFSVKGFNLFQPTTRLLCALEGKYLVQESCYNVMDGDDTFVEHDEIQCLRFSCSIPNVTGRGFIEVEDHGLSSSFFPFIVAEQDVCYEICKLESAIEEAETADADESQGRSEIIEARDQALDFIQEMGWLLHRSHLKFRLGHMDPNLNLFPFRRFRWLMEFSIEHDWCAVVKKLLGILFNGSVDVSEHPSLEFALQEMGLLHRAVRRNCRSMVEALLRYVPDTVSNETGSEQNQHIGGGNKFFFRPDVIGPGGLTPLHIAASGDGSQSVLDALTDDPGMVGIEAWKGVCDITGLTPHDYAIMRSHYSYINLVQKKINKKSGRGHVVLDIPGTLFDGKTKQKLEGHKSGKVASFDTQKNGMKPSQRRCKLCEQKLAYGNARTSLAIYRPAMLSMVAIAAVCVCVALLFKSSPEVLYIFQPFRWELLKYGSS